MPEPIDTKYETFVRYRWCRVYLSLPLDCLVLRNTTLYAGVTWLVLQNLQRRDGQ
jgi:hypothetical protein